MRKVTTYERLDNHYLDWYEGDRPFFAIIGRPGIGKSWKYEELLAKEVYTSFRGKTTALRIFMDVQDHPDRRIVFDDVGQLLRDPACVELMKILCDTRPERTVRWNTNTRLLEGRQREFTTCSPVLMVCNRTLLDNEDVKAVLDRADAIEFDPPKTEIITKLRSYADDQEIVDFLEKMPVLPSLRTYDLARGWKKSTRIDWRQEVMAECGVEEHVQVLVEILRNEHQKEWLERYMARTGRSRRDYFNQLSVARELAACTSDCHELLQE